MNITENELKMYLGTKLKVQGHTHGQIEELFMINDTSIYVKSQRNLAYGAWADIQDIKPILYPLSMLTQPIWHEGKEVNVMVEVRKLTYNIKFFYEDDTMALTMNSLAIWNLLAHYHIDFQNLIGQGKAISVTNEFNPYM